MTRSSMQFIGASQLGLRVIPASTRPYDFVRVAILRGGVPILKMS